MTTLWKGNHQWKSNWKMDFKSTVVCVHFVSKMHFVDRAKKIIMTFHHKYIKSCWICGPVLKLKDAELPFHFGVNKLGAISFASSRVRQEDGGHQGVKAPQEGVYLAPRWAHVVHTSTSATCMHAFNPLLSFLSLGQGEPGTAGFPGPVGEPGVGLSGPKARYTQVYTTLILPWRED